MYLSISCLFSNPLLRSHEFTCRMKSKKQIKNKHNNAFFRSKKTTPQTRSDDFVYGKDRFRCRAPRKSSVHISVIIIQCQQFHSVCFYFSICVYVILMMFILDGYEKVKYMMNYKMLYNDTYALDYI